MTTCPSPSSPARRARASHCTQQAKVVGEPAELQWDTGGMLSDLATTTNIDAQLGSTEGRMTKYGKIDHLRGWHNSVSSLQTVLHDAGIDDDDMVQAESESTQVVICDLCEQMGNMMPAVQSCLDCGDVPMCQVCLESTHFDKKKNKKFRHHKLVPIISVDREVNPNGVEVYVPDTGSSAAGSVSGLVSPGQVASYDRIPFRSEVPVSYNSQERYLLCVCVVGGAGERGGIAPRS